MPAKRLVLTFDNLGEAAALEAGRWRGARLGEDLSVTVALPRLLALLEELALRATFFVEAWNVAHYPDAIRDVARRGHEVGLHGWRHERWSELTPEQEADVIARGSAALATLGIAARGFRPPGGAMSAQTPSLLLRSGFTWSSPVSHHARTLGSLSAVPFDWKLVDATYVNRRFGGLRRELGLAEAPMDAATVDGSLRAAAAASPSPLVLVLHPFLALEPSVWDAHCRLLRWVATREDLQVTRGCDLPSITAPVPER